MKNVGQQLVDEFQYILGVEKLFNKKLPFEEWFDVWVASPAGKVSMQSTNEDFPPRVAEKIGRKQFCITHKCKGTESQIHQRIGTLFRRVQESSR